MRLKSRNLLSFLGVVLYGGLLLTASPSARADRQALALLNQVQSAAQAAGTLSANFTYTTTTPSLTQPSAAPTIRTDSGTLVLSKPNLADIILDKDTPFERHIVSDGITVWIYFPHTNSYTKAIADPQGKNINVWRLITIGGFFSVYTWLREGVYVDDLSELTYAGNETVAGVPYQVIEHKMTGSLQGQPSPFVQKIYIGSDNLIHRFTLDFTLGGKPGSEVAELTNIQTGQAMTPQRFAFQPPTGAQELMEGALPVDLKTQALLQKVQTATMAASSLQADFAYTENSAKTQQTTLGTVSLMRPNFARVTFSSMPRPNFPNLVASNGTLVYKFTPSNFTYDNNGTFSDAPYDPAQGALAASGLAAGHGTITTTPASADGTDIHLWDGMPVNAFFDPHHAIQRYVFAGDPDTMTYEGEEVVDGVTYQVLKSTLAGGNIAGGETTPFLQHLYIGPDDLIHIYKLEFTSQGKPGIETFTLTNIRLNVPMTPAQFQFVPPVDTGAATEQAQTVPLGK